MKKCVLLLAVIFTFAAVSVSHAALLTFDDAISGEISYSFDGDGDLVDDVVFTTSDISGFNTLGPGPNMTYISEPGLEGTTSLSVDLRVDFLVGAVDYLSFGFALDDYSESGNTWGSFGVYDASNTLLASAFQFGLYTLPDGMNQSDFPEGYISVVFSGVASYALFNFNTDSSGGGRYMIDNFEGNFGTSRNPATNPVPEPMTVFLLGGGLLGMFGTKRKKMEEV